MEKLCDDFYDDGIIIRIIEVPFEGQTQEHYAMVSPAQLKVLEWLRKEEIILDYEVYRIDLDA
jgi:hypothetical protein